MALIGSMLKQPGEILPVDISYADVIGGRVVTSITPTITVPGGMTKVSEQVSGQVLQIYLSGGVNATSYRWTVACDIVIGGRTTRVEDEFDVVVEEI